MSRKPSPIFTSSNRWVKEITVKSTAFNYNGIIPKRYTADGANINPSLILHNIPDETQSMMLLVEDPDAPIDTWVHWLVWNIYPSTKIYEDSIPGIEGLNSFRQFKYAGPCPTSGTHHYFFRVYALDTFLDLPNKSTKRDAMRATRDHVVGCGELMGLYNRYNCINLRHEPLLNIYR